MASRVYLKISTKGILLASVLSRLEARDTCHACMPARRAAATVLAPLTSAVRALITSVPSAAAAGRGFQ